jgi:hypothetical protein
VQRLERAHARALLRGVFARVISVNLLATAVVAVPVLGVTTILDVSAVLGGVSAAFPWAEGALGLPRGD